MSASEASDWSALRVELNGRTLYGEPRKRALGLWREGQGHYQVTAGGVSVAPAEVDWTGHVVPPGRKGGAVPADADRGTVPLQVRVERGVPELLAQEAERRGQSKGALLGELVRASVLHGKQAVK